MTNQIEVRRPIPAAPVHPLAALSTLLLDGVFGLPEMVEILDPPLLLLTGLAVGMINAAAVTLVQHHLAHDEWGPALAKGVVMGIIAGVPFPVLGTAAGGLFLGWAGMHEWIKLPPPKQ